jgi:hypothetical protein
VEKAAAECVAVSVAVSKDTNDCVAEDVSAYDSLWPSLREFIDCWVAGRGRSVSRWVSRSRREKAEYPRPASLSRLGLRTLEERRSDGRPGSESLRLRPFVFSVGPVANNSSGSFIEVQNTRKKTKESECGCTDEDGREARINFGSNTWRAWLCFGDP